MNAFTRLTDHLKAHAYKRGAYVNDAPADRSRRGKTNFRVSPYGGNMTIVFHNTRIVTAYPDGHLILDCGGWADSSTTKAAMQDALWLCDIRGYLTSKLLFSKRHLCYVGAGDTVLYYDGMALDETGKVTSALKPFPQRRRNRAETKEFDEQVKESGFKDMFKLLHNVCESEDGVEWNTSARRGSVGEVVRQAMTEEVHINKWKPLIAAYAWETEARWSTFNGGQVIRTAIKRDASATWSALTKAAKTDMYETVLTDTFRV
jgi:hypothetical protein